MLGDTRGEEEEEEVAEEDGRWKQEEAPTIVNWAGAVALWPPHNNIQPCLQQFDCHLQFLH